MSFATTDDIGNRLGRTLTSGEETAITALLENASAVVADAAGKDEADISPVPGIVKVVTIELVCRALANPNGVVSMQEQLGAASYSARFRDEGGGILLTDREERLVRRAVHGTLSGSSRPAGTIDELYDLAYGS